MSKNDTRGNNNCPQDDSSTDALRGQDSDSRTDSSTESAARDQIDPAPSPDESTDAGHKQFCVSGLGETGERVAAYLFNEVDDEAYLKSEQIAGNLPGLSTTAVGTALGKLAKQTTLPIVVEKWSGESTVVTWRVRHVDESDMRQVTVRFPHGLLESLDHAVEAGEWANRSEAIRESVRETFVDEPELVADGGRDVTANDLSLFQQNILLTLADEGEALYGLRIKRKLQELYDVEEVNHGRLYPNLDELVELGLIDKRARDKRTNEYELTHAGALLLLEDADRRYLIVGKVRERRKETPMRDLVTDGGSAEIPGEALLSEDEIDHRCRSGKKQFEVLREKAEDHFPETAAAIEDLLEDIDVVTALAKQEEPVNPPVTDGGAIDHGFDDAEVSTREQLLDEYYGNRTEPIPGSVAIDLVTRQVLFIRGRVADTLVEYYEAEDFDLLNYKMHPYLPVCIDDAVYECVFVPADPDLAHKPGKTYDYPRGRLCVLPVEEAWEEDE